MDIKQETANLNDELIGLRRDFHKHPELGAAEHRTAGIVESYLKDLHIPVRRIGETGVTGHLAGDATGKTVMLRADMDALPITEETDLPYRSVHSGVMHACGHDGHTAMLLVAAKILSRHRDRIPGGVKFVFQPNEENTGAADMILGGVLEDPKVEAAFGIHLWTPLPAGRIAVTPGPIMAGMEQFDIEITGKGGHTAAPHMSVDPIYVASTIVRDVESIRTRRTDPMKPLVILFGRIEGGTAANIIPETVRLSGTLRYLFDPAEDNPKERLQRIVMGVCRTHGAYAEIRFHSGHPPLINDAAMTEHVKRAAENTLPPGVDVDSLVSMAGEDFSEFTGRVPGAFYFIGAGNPEKGIVHPHHHPSFDIDEGALAVGVEMHVRTVLGFFEAPPESP